MEGDRDARLRDDRARRPDGMSPDDTTAGFVLWMRGRGVLVDPPAHSGRPNNLNPNPNPNPSLILTLTPAP